MTKLAQTAASRQTSTYYEPFLRFWHL